MWIFLPFILWPIVIFLLFSLIILPFKFTLYSLVNIITIPFELIKIATNKNLRINHALEHATINVLEEKYGYKGLSGYAKEKGFIVNGPVEPRHIEEAALEGLYRLRRGEKSLAIHNRCGTSMLAVNFVFAIIFLTLLFLSGMFSLWNMILALFFSQMIGPFAGKIFQKFFTTSTDVENYYILGIDYDWFQSSRFWFFYRIPTQFYVKTAKKIIDPFSSSLTSKYY